MEFDFLQGILADLLVWLLVSRRRWQGRRRSWYIWIRIALVKVLISSYPHFEVSCRWIKIDNGGGLKDWSKMETVLYWEKVINGFNDGVILTSCGRWVWDRCCIDAVNFFSDTRILICLLKERGNTVDDIMACIMQVAVGATTNLLRCWIIYYFNWYAMFAGTAFTFWREKMLWQRAKNDNSTSL